eukprot:5870750-Alexandrium_andersonii.AAC.1
MPGGDRKGGQHTYQDFADELRRHIGSSVYRCGAVPIKLIGLSAYRCGAAPIKLIGLSAYRCGAAPI